MKDKIIFIDFDNTILNGETTDYIDIDNLSEITNKAMCGEIDYYNSLINKIKLMRGYSMNKLNQIVYNLKYNKNITEFIGWCHNNNYYVIVLSGGLDFVLNYSQLDLNYDFFFCNYLRVKDGLLTGEINGPMMEDNSKGLYVKKFQKMLNISYKNCVSIGDGCNDISMFKQTYTSISFCGKEKVKECATFHIDTPDFNIIKEILESIN